MAKSDDYSEVQQLRAEIGLLRAKIEEAENYRKETEAQKKAFADFLAWIDLSTEQKTQLAADRRFADAGGDSWQVTLRECPTVRLPAHSEYEAIGRYQEICGIISTEHKFTCARVA